MTQNTVAAQAGRKPQKKSQFSGMSRALVRRETISAYLFLLPSLIFFVTFVVVPMFICLFYSFTAVSYTHLGTYYMYPLSVAAHCMAINYEAFEAAGALQYIDEETRTWTTDNFVKAMEAVRDAAAAGTINKMCIRDRHD